MTDVNVDPAKASHATVTREICSLCVELDLRSLFLPPNSSSRSMKFQSRSRRDIYSDEDMKWVRKERRNQRNRGAAILFRLVFNNGFPLQSQCWICTRLKSWGEALPIGISNLFRLHGIPSNEYHDSEAEKLPREFSFEIPERHTNTFPKYRSRLRIEGRHKIDFGVNEASGLSQSWLPSVNIVEQTINYTTVRSWLSQCTRCHDRCRMTDSVEPNVLQRIWLFDVYERKLVPYTQSLSPETKGGERPGFVALSYIWGGVRQPAINPGVKVDYKLPLTIEHAIVIVQELGIRFIWVDSLCINQSNNGDKMQQIAHMDSIYRLATATIILLDSANACSGIPGVSYGADDSVPFIPRIAQLNAGIRVGERGASVISLHPTLNDEVWGSAWSKRAWTYQEGILSRRRIIVSRHQVYFSCTEMEDAEDHATPILSDWSYSRTLVDPLDGLDMYNIKECNSVYMIMVDDYSHRLMSDQDDGLNAINGVLATWERKMPSRRFIFAMPVWAFRYALIWEYSLAGGDIWNEVRPVRRNRDMFPSWSWCGWEFKKPIEWNHMLGSLGHQEKSHLPSIISAIWNGQVLVRDCHEEGGETDGPTGDTLKDPAWMLLEELTRPDRNKRNSSSVSLFNETFLQIRGILIQIPCNYGTAGPRAEPYVKVDIPGFSVLRDIDPVKLVFQDRCTYYDWVIVAMSISDTIICLWGILLLWDSKGTVGDVKIASRAGRIWYESNRENFFRMWERLVPRVETFWLC